MKTEIIYQDNAILVCRKPAGLPVQTARIGQMDMVSELKNYLTMGKTLSAGEPYLGIVHRLDQPVEGLILFGKTKQASAALSKQLQGNELNKTYYAVACKQPLVEKGMLEDYMIKDASTGRAQIVTSTDAQAKKAILRYELLDVVAERVLYRVKIETGRFHQIRAQMAHAGMALLGDQKYADAETLAFSRECGIRNVALCAYEIALKHPVTGKEMSFSIVPSGEGFQGFFEK